MLEPVIVGKTLSAAAQLPLLPEACPFGIHAGMLSPKK